ncbi:murein biosynthesis integral membrane protein MurJ [Holdemania filiformis]|uniref:murein biosynthesis integral membrane protein MurJ n=1 Tax=Holdemania filiformis TaxID=61171 RepID=UPI00242EC99A|nr:lipid II flippase MurJ [Holdemania filiformis]
MKHNKIIQGILVVLSFSLIAKILSAIIELSVAYKFGATHETDVFYIVYGIIQTLTPMITIGVWKVYMPVYKEKQIENRDREANTITDQLVVIFVLFCVFITIFIYVFPQLFLKIFAPGFDEYSNCLGRELLRIMSFMFVFGILAVFRCAILQSNNLFGKSQLKNIVTHIPALVYLIFWGASLSIKDLSMTIVIGELFSAIVLIVISRDIYRFSFPKKIIDNQTINILKRVPAGCLSAIINQLNSVIDKAFSSTLQMGAVTYLNNGGKLIGLLDGVFSTAIGTALFPNITELYVKGEKKTLADLMKKYVLSISCFLIPVSFILFICSDNIIQIILGHGMYDKIAVENTSRVLAVYGIGLLAMSVNVVTNDILYIMKKVNLLTVVNLLNIMYNIILDFLFVRKIGVAGLALATSISFYVSVSFKVIYLRDMFMFDIRFLHDFILIIISCVPSAIAIIVFRYCFDFGTYINLIIAVISFGTIYVALMLVINPTFRNVCKKIIRKSK